jgi:RsiW-degrading membrane proteinase PrsW (M82 family)
MALFPSKRSLHALSRQPAFLAKLTAAILGTGVLLTWLVAPSDPFADNAARFRSMYAADSRDAVPALLERIRDAATAHSEVPSEEEVVDDSPPAVPPASPDAPATEDPSDLTVPGLTPEENALLNQYAEAFQRPKPPRALVEQCLASVSAPEDAGSLHLAMAADILRQAGEDKPALAGYDRGAAATDTIGQYCRRRAMELCAARQWLDALTTRYTTQGWAPSVIDAPEAEEADAVILAARDWPGLFRHSWNHVAAGSRQTLWLLLTGTMATVWFLTIVMLCGIPRRRWWLCGLALVLGIFSVVPVLMLVMAQHRLSPLHLNGTPFNDLVYYVSGVGLREELAKLLVLLPLLPLLRNATPAMYFAAASCIGLGFAVEENLNYMAASMGTASLPRFITANFLHIALTGLSGGFLGLAIRWPRSFFHEFAIVFIGAILAHGLYDWGLSPGSGSEGGTIQWFTFLGVAWFYFQNLRRFGDRLPAVIAPQAVWITGVSLIAVLTMVTVGSQFGFRLAMASAVLPAIALFTTAALIIWQIRHH